MRQAKARKCRLAKVAARRSSSRAKRRKAQTRVALDSPVFGQHRAAREGATKDHSLSLTLEGEGSRLVDRAACSHLCMSRLSPALAREIRGELVHAQCERELATLVQVMLQHMPDDPGARQVDVCAVPVVGKGLVHVGGTPARQTLRHELPSAVEALGQLGGIAHQQGNDALAQAHFQDSLMLIRTLTESSAIGRCLLGLSRLASRTGQFWQAVRMRAAAESSLNLEQEMSFYEQALYEQDNDALRAHLGEAAFAKAQAEGQNMTLEQVLGAREPSSTTPLPSSKASTEVLPDHLTPREVEVLRLIARGLTDVRIAKLLVISPRTVNFHLTGIYHKIQVSSRSAATRYAIEHHLT